MTISTPNDQSGNNNQRSKVGDALGANNTRQPGQEEQPSIRRANAFMPRTFKVRGSGESVRTLADAMEKQFPPEARDVYRLITLDDPTTLAISALILARRDLVDNKEHVFFCTMLIEASSRVPPTRTDTINNTSIEIVQVASDALDPRMWESIKQRVGEVFPSRHTEFHNAGAMVVHSTVDPKNEQAVAQVLAAAGRAVDGHFAQAFNRERPFSISWFPSDARVNSRISYNPAPVIDASGNPVRTDVTVEVICRVNQGGQQSIHNDEVAISRVGAFVDLIYQKPAQPQFQGQPMTTKRYAARAVITSIDSELDANSLELRLFGLVSGGMLLSRNLNWAGVFLPRHGVDVKKDTRDIGAIGYEVPLDAARPNEPFGQKLKTRDAKFTRQDLGELIRAAFIDDLVLSYDVVELGPDSWLDETFLMSASNMANATAAVLEAANNLTKGLFEKHYKGGPVLVDDNNRIHLGYFKGDDGELHDIRELDYLALLNLTGDKSLQAVIDWSDSFDNPNLLPAMRLDVRRQLLQARFNSNLHINGYARRLTWAPTFLIPLANACAEAGLIIRPENLVLDLSGGTTRGYYDAAAMGIGPQNPLGLFNYGGTGYVGAQVGSGYVGFNTQTFR